MTDKITQPETMTDGQRKQIKRLFEDCFTGIDLDALGLSKEEAQILIEKGDIMQGELKEFILALLKKNAVTGVVGPKTRHMLKVLTGM